jgi:hypothetical protein
VAKTHAARKKKITAVLRILVFVIHLQFFLLLGLSGIQSQRYYIPSELSRGGKAQGRSRFNGSSWGT